MLNLPRAPRLLIAAAALALVPLSSAGPQAAGATTTANLLTGDTALLQRSVGTWVGAGATVARAATGVLSLNATVNGTVGAVSGAAGSAVPATPGRVYTGTFSVSAVTTGRPVDGVLQFFAQDGSVLARAMGERVGDAVGGWTAVPAVVGIAPAGTVSVALSEFVWGVTAPESHLLRQPVLTVASSSPRDVVGPLRTSGTHVYDAKGQLVLRGINRRGLELSNPVAVTSDEIAQAKRWGATTVRLQLSSAYWLSTNCNYQSGYAAAVDRAVSAITSQKMVALLDLHTNTLLACGQVKQQPMADMTAIGFWQQVANRYKGNPLVAFDLYNEPHDISHSVWLLGGQVATSSGVFQAAGMQQMYNAVRNTGADNLVVISGEDWASNPPTLLVTGVNIVYAAHVYTCTTSTTNCGPNPYDPSPVLSRWDNLSATVPVAVTEFGWPSPLSGQFNRNVVSYAVQHGWGWTGFAWDGTTSGDYSLLGTLGQSYEPSPAGMPVLAGLTP